MIAVLLTFAFFAPTHCVGYVDDDMPVWHVQCTTAPALVLRTP